MTLGRIANRLFAFYCIARDKDERLAQYYLQGWLRVEELININALAKSQSLELHTVADQERV